MKFLLSLTLMSMVLFAACSTETPGPAFTGAENEVTIMNMNPGHFHAGLIHLHDYDQVSSQVFVYAPGGRELDSYLAMVDRFNNRSERPTSWQPQVYTGADYLERMIADRPGNMMVMAGNNRRKIEYVSSAIDNGINVMSDKPMIIHPDQFPILQQALASADEQGLVVNDMMTERHAIANILQGELSHIPELFGQVLPGTPDDPSIIKESVHFLYKTVAGETLVRPAWFFDTEQQGEAIVDVSTHLVDQVLWQTFPQEPIDYRRAQDGVGVVDAHIRTLDLTRSQFELITGEPDFPAYLHSEVVQDSIYQMVATGEFTFTVRGIHAMVSAQWGFTNPDGGDTHFSLTRGSKADLVIRQDVEQDFKATLYVVPVPGAHDDDFASVLQNALDTLSDRYSGLRAQETEFGWEILVPDRYVETHEEHFTRVTQRYLDALVQGQLPEWERVNLETKYYLTTEAYRMSR